MNSRDHILKRLEECKGEYISGMSLAEELSVSRNAVWKIISRLKKEGYNIESVTNRGYRLAPESDIISVQGIARFLSNPSDEGVIEVYDELDSTNKTAKLRLVRGETDRAVIVARRQTAGVGHGSIKYKSPDGGIYISIIVPADEMKKKVDSFPSSIKSYIGETAREVITGLTSKSAELKELNRIYIGGRKVCGILTEYFADLESGEISSFVIGIGIKMEGVEKNRFIAEIINRFYE